MAAAEDSAEEDRQCFEYNQEARTRLFDEARMICAQMSAAEESAEEDRLDFEA